MPRARLVAVLCGVAVFGCPAMSFMDVTVRRMPSGPKNVSLT